MQGGGTGQFAAVALNLIGKTGTADYIVSGEISMILFVRVNNISIPRRLLFVFVTICKFYDLKRDCGGGLKTFC